jgi:hypothetical protein
MVLYFGSAIFKIARLLFVAMSCVHVFACVFYRVKKESALSIDDVNQFFISRNVDPTVRTPDEPIVPSFSMHKTRV